MENYHNEKVIILIDEYDVPLENAYFAGFYDEMSALIRSLMESALKTNESLKFAVITGCLRISKESIFTGLNNLNVISIVSDNYAECFGFTQPEVTQMLKYYELEDKAEEVERWYDGYLFGQTHVYNPWSVNSYLNGVIADKITYPRPYWANISSNSIIRELIEKADDNAKAEIEDLMSGETIVKQIHEDITYGGTKAYLTMAIPNMEVRYIYENSIMQWMNRSVKKMNLDKLHEAVLTGDCETFQTIVSSQLKSNISYYDENESFYHGFLMGLMSSLEQYRILSNRETGVGRADLILKPFDEQKAAVIMELKYAGNIRQLEEGCEKALQQIKEKHYEDELLEDGCQNIIEYGICFHKKTCKIKCNTYTN